MKRITVELEKTRELEPLVHELYPYYGMGFTYTLTPPAELPSERVEHSGLLKKFARSGMIIRIVPQKFNGLTTHLKVFVSQPGKRQKEHYYHNVKSHLAKDFCKPLQEKPAEFEAIVRELIV